MDQDESLALGISIIVLVCTIGCTGYTIYKFCKNHSMPKQEEAYLPIGSEQP